LQGSLTGFFDVMLQTGTGFLGIEFAAPGSKGDGIITGYHIYVSS
jgi:hypothetical protein